MFFNFCAFSYYKCMFSKKIRIFLTFYDEICKNNLNSHQYL
ncbi:hypothetical protein MuYL_3136 [Mucilaginibacter xinganensis]|uniref:Uncharacterized protein n=1 Tax=Mucilaginibacter xinganensis TaxID=1234841 RepID=A0A223NZL9_9SPHI|nr:hypothetical protein MuYL_3136 [Mucilaginibacter xinganensis]